MLLSNAFREDCVRFQSCYVTPVITEELKRYYVQLLSSSLENKSLQKPASRVRGCARRMPQSALTPQHTHYTTSRADSLAHTEGTFFAGMKLRS
jgi:hypothetical protein